MSDLLRDSISFPTQRRVRPTRESAIKFLHYPRIPQSEVNRETGSMKVDDNLKKSVSGKKVKLCDHKTGCNDFLRKEI